MAGMFKKLLASGIAAKVICGGPQAAEPGEDQGLRRPDAGKEEGAGPQARHPLLSPPPASPATTSGPAPGRPVPGAGPFGVIGME